MLAVYIFSFQYLPLQDFPQWIYHGHVFNQIVFHSNDFGGYFSLHHYIPPNACATVLIGLFEMATTPLIAGKLFLFISLILVYSGSWLVLTSLTGTKHILFAFIALGSCFNLFFYGGFINFLFGLGIALLGISYVLTHRSTGNPYLLSLIFLLCYLSHFASLLIVLVPVLAVIIYEREMKFAGRILLAMIPVIVLFLHYYLTKEITTFSPGDPAQSNYLQTLWGSVSHAPAAMMPIHRIKHVLELPVVENIVNYGFAFAAILAVAFFVISVIVKRRWSLLSIIGFLTTITVIFSPAYLGGLFSLGQRFVFLLWLVMVAYFFLRYPSPKIHMVETIIASIVAIGSFSILWYGTAIFNDMDIPSHTREASTPDPRGGSNPFEHFHFYDDIEQNRGVPVFHSALLDYKGAQNSKPFDQ